jgi:glutamyl-tRNA synthetase
MSSRPVKTRFAPSPTGLLHLGNMRTALFNWLLARRHGGVFLLRLEDTDAMRGHEKYAAALQHDLRWLGLEWDEGPGAGGAHGPYAQSERGDLYKEYFGRLERQGLAYPCFCSEHELAIERKLAIANHRPPRYSGKCRGLAPDAVQARLAKGEPATLRFRVPEARKVGFGDQVRGPQVFDSADLGDFVIRRSDGTPAFFFCNALDDALMGVTLVVRGEDHLTNTPRQILLLEALGLPLPEYAHIALVTGPDGAPLSKRTGSKSVEALRAAGYLPLALCNYLARLGHTCEDNALLDLERLAAGFAVERLHRAPARFDEAQLRHWQKEAVQRASGVELWTWMGGREYPQGRIEDLVPRGTELDFVDTVRGNVVLPDDACQWARNLYAPAGHHDEETRALVRATGSDFFGMARQLLEREGGDFKPYSQALARATGAKGKALYMPLRAALTGATHGPEMDRLWKLLGRERIKQRLDAAFALCQS